MIGAEPPSSVASYQAPQADAQSLAPHVAELDSDERAILDLSLRYGFSDERLAPMLQIDLDEVADRREAALSELGERAGVDADADRPALEQALREVPHDSWLGRELRDPSPEPAGTPGNGAPPAAATDDAVASATPRAACRGAPSAVAAVAALVAAIVLLAGGGDGDGASHGPPASRAAGSATTPAPERSAPKPSGGGASHDGAQGHGSAHAGGGSAAPVTLKPIPGAAPSHATIRLVAAGPPPRIASPSARRPRSRASTRSGSTTR